MSKFSRRTNYSQRIAKSTKYMDARRAQLVIDGKNLTHNQAPSSSVLELKQAYQQARRQVGVVAIRRMEKDELILNTAHCYINTREQVNRVEPNTSDISLAEIAVGIVMEAMIDVDDGPWNDTDVSFGIAIARMAMSEVGISADLR